MWQFANIVELKTLTQLLSACYGTENYREKTEDFTNFITSPCQNMSTCVQ